MDERLEVLLSSESTGQMWNMCVWDPSTGSSLRTYKGHSTKAKTASFIGNSYMISVQPTKPLLNVWMIKQHEQQPLKYTTPGELDSLAASPSGHIIIGTNEERIYIWQTASGKLLKIVTVGHYQKINMTRFTQDGSHFITAGEDGNALLWSLEGVVNQSSDKCKPRSVWNHHSLGITDLHLGFGGIKSRLFTCSKDRTVKAYCVASGQYLLNVEFPTSLSSIVVDSAEENLYVGSSKGTIYTVSLKSPPRDLKLNVEESPENTFKGHTMAVTCLSVSLDGLSLASGSEDKDVRLWHINSRQCLKILPHKGIVTTLLYMIPKPGMLKPEDYKEELTFSLLEKTAVDKQDIIDKQADLYTINIMCQDKEDVPIKEPSARELLRSYISNPAKTTRGSAATNNIVTNNTDKEILDDEDESPLLLMQQEIKNLKAINQQLYEAAIKKVIRENSIQ